MNQNNSFLTTCNGVGELLGILKCAETTKQVATLYYSNEEIVSRDEEIKQEFKDKSNELKNHKNEKEQAEHYSVV